MSADRIFIGWLITCIFTVLTGCAAPGLQNTPSAKTGEFWRGRLAVRVTANTVSTPSQSFSAGFELSGTPQAGDLAFFTPIGTTAAQVHWTPSEARLQTPSETRSFVNLNTLLLALLGTDVPVTALFAWLNGRSVATDGWTADLTERNLGKISAHKLLAPQAELLILLEP